MDRCLAASDSLANYLNNQVVASLRLLSHHRVEVRFVPQTHEQMHVCMSGNACPRRLRLRQACRRHSRRRNILSDQSICSQSEIIDLICVKHDEWADLNQKLIQEPANLSVSSFRGSAFALRERERACLPHSLPSLASTDLTTKAVRRQRLVHAMRLHALVFGNCRRVCSSSTFHALD